MAPVAILLHTRLTGLARLHKAGRDFAHILPSHIELRPLSKSGTDNAIRRPCQFAQVHTAHCNVHDPTMAALAGQLSPPSATRAFRQVYQYHGTLGLAQGTMANDSPSVKRSLNVDSPSFTPATLSVPGKASAISSQAANAAPFTPRGLASGKSSVLLVRTKLTMLGTVTPISHTDAEPAAFNPAQIREFTPQSYDLSQTVSSIPSRILM